MLYLCHANDQPGRVLQHLTVGGQLKSGQLVRWMFLGRNYLRLVEWEEELGPGFERINYAGQLQALALVWRESYLDWIARLGYEHNSLEWWSSMIAERNTMIMSLYHLICYLHIALEYALDATPPDLIVAESDAVLDSLAGEVQLRGRVRRLITSVRLPDELRLALRLVYAWIRYGLDAWRAMDDARKTRRDDVMIPPAAIGTRVVMHTCIDDTYFGKDGQAHDRYFPGLADELRSRGFTVCVIPWLYNLQRPRRAAFRWFREHSGEYLIPEDFYSLPDYLWAAGVILRQLRIPPGQRFFQGLNITRLVREARWQQAGAAGHARFVLYFRLIEKWARLGLKFDYFVDMFENMLTEKPQVMALRRWMPSVTTVGFQHFMSMYPLMLNLFTSEAEASFAPHPDVIVCNSPFTARQALAAHFPKAKVRVGPSLRFQHLAASRVNHYPEDNTVLVILSLDVSATKEVLWKIFRAFPQDERLCFWVKRHPMMSVAQFDSLLKGRPLPAHMTRVDGPLEQWLERAACVVAVTTSSALEVVLAGAPVVLAGRETDFDMNPLAGFHDFDPPANSPGELRAQVLKNLALSTTERAQLHDKAQRMIHQCYSPLSDEAIMTFVRPRASAPIAVQTA